MRCARATGKVGDENVDGNDEQAKHADGEVREQQSDGDRQPQRRGGAESGSARATTTAERTRTRRSGAQTGSWHMGHGSVPEPDAR